MWPRIVADTLGRHVAATCMLCMQTLCLWRGRATACRTLEPQTAVCSPKSLKIMVSYGNKYPRHNARPHVVEQSGQCARALIYGNGLKNVRERKGLVSMLRRNKNTPHKAKQYITQCIKKVRNYRKKNYNYIQYFNSSVPDKFYFPCF